MKIAGIICEYNPFHLGHKRQLDWIRSQIGPECAIVCLMSGNFVQRGYPAIIDKSLRAEAALKCGADLVLELPITASLSSAEGFAASGVKILSGFCNYLSFGSETGNIGQIMETAQALLAPDFPEKLRSYLDTGLSFPAARHAALGTDLLTKPNDILAVEYCKAILSQKSTMEPLVITRQGDYHAQHPDLENPSATALRNLMTAGDGWKHYVPEEAAASMAGASLHLQAYGEKAILCKLRTMTDADFETLPYGSEGLWRKLMHAVRKYATLEEILTEVKSKRYTRTRLDRMVMCAYLGITREMMTAPTPYVRVLGLNNKGREVLKKARLSGNFPNAGEPISTEYAAFEQCCGDLYGLFSEVPEAPGTEAARRVIYIR